MLSGFNLRESDSKLYPVETLKLLKRDIFLGSSFVESLSFTLASKVLANEKLKLLDCPNEGAPFNVPVKRLYCTSTPSSPKYSS